MLRKVTGTSLHYEMMFSDWFLLFNSHLTSRSQDEENDVTEFTGAEENDVTEFTGAILSHGVVSEEVTGSVRVVSYVCLPSIVKS